MRIGHLHIEPPQRRENNVIIVELSGELDGHTSEGLWETFLDLLRQGVGDCIIIVDMSGVEFIDSVGIGTLVRGLDEFTQSRSEFVLVGLAPEIKRPFDLTGVSKIMPIYSSVDKLSSRRGLQVCDRAVIA